MIFKHCGFPNDPVVKEQKQLRAHLIIFKKWQRGMLSYRRIFVPVSDTEARGSFFSLHEEVRKSQRFVQ